MYTYVCKSFFRKDRLNLMEYELEEIFPENSTEVISLRYNEIKKRYNEIHTN